jgi:predicted ATPase/DNA-binding SARP family transcriptional activator
VHGYVSDWRQALEPARPRRSSGRYLLSVPGGYRLELAPGLLDVARFRTAAAAGRTALAEGDLAQATERLAEALGQWRGSALQDLADVPFAAAAAAALEAARLDVVEQLAALQLRLGRADLALPLVTEDAGVHLTRERLTELRMTALYRLGRQAEALDAYEGLRRSLRTELGVDPGAPLRQLHLRVLRHDPALERDVDDAAAQVPVLPVPLTSFVGRDGELAAVARAQSAGHRLVTLLGPPGSGKTRLALEVALRRSRDPAGGAVAFLDMSRVRSADVVLVAVAEALGLREVTDRTTALELGARLGSRRALVVLDDADLLLAAAPHVAQLLAAAPGLAVLATAREPLAVTGELLLDVRPLPVPHRGERDLERLRASDAVRLFLERVRTASGGAVSDADLPVVGGICRRLDGLPLALELAAPWTRTLGLPALLEQLDHSTDLLADGFADRPVRHRTLRTAVDRSWHSLTPEQRALLEQMSVLASPVAFEAVRALVGSAHAAVLLRALVERSLVLRVGDPDSPRYALLTTLRQYAAERLAARPQRSVGPGTGMRPWSPTCWPGRRGAAHRTACPVPSTTSWRRCVPRCTTWPAPASTAGGSRSRWTPSPRGGTADGWERASSSCRGRCPLPARRRRSDSGQRRTSAARRSRRPWARRRPLPTRQPPAPSSPGRPVTWPWSQQRPRRWATSSCGCARTRVGACWRRPWPWDGRRHRPATTGTGRHRRRSSPRAPTRWPSTFASASPTTPGRCSSST